ncbi:MAG: SDR family NAD(P)-dependent oxidoreductase [Candidatus Omnitrophica bacterium]|nr:SDR family NAD(P)-dependent oxidoreductase [Candidatus Omnitrophota bacterium]
MKWNGKNVLVTGADGFIGSHLVERLVKMGAEVRAFVFYNSFNSWGWLDGFKETTLKQVDIFSGDIRDPNGVLEAMKDIDIVFHLAALIGIPFSYHSPDSYVDTNIKGTLNVLQAARKWSVKKVVHTSTSEIYGTAQYAPIDESHPVNPQSPYAATKAAADSLALSFYRSFDLPVTILRPFNTFGPRQSARAIIPTIISQIYSGKKSLILGNLKATRDFNFVGNTVDAFLKVAESKKSVGEIFNTGSGKEVSIGEMADLIMKITHRKVEIKTSKDRLRPEKSEVGRLICNAQKIQSVCGWNPETSLEEGLTLTCRWIKENMNHFKTDIYNV